MIVDPDTKVTQAQTARIQRLEGVLGLELDDAHVTHVPDLPPGWVQVTHGVKKGRPKILDLSPKGLTYE